MVGHIFHECCLSVCLSVHPSVRPSVCLSVCLSVSLSVCQRFVTSHAYPQNRYINQNTPTQNYKNYYQIRNNYFSQVTRAKRLQSLFRPEIIVVIIFASMVFLFVTFCSDRKFSCEDPDARHFRCRVSSHHGWRELGPFYSVRFCLSVCVCVCFFCETMGGVSRPSRVVLTSETHPKSVGVCPR